MKVLFDHSIIQDGLRGEHVLQYESYNPNRNNLAKFIYCERPGRIDWKQKEIDCLPNIANFARVGRIVAFTTVELMAENRVQKFPNFEYNVFTNVKFEIALAPLDRSKWGLSIEQYFDKEQVIAYCECFFLTPTSERTERFISGMKSNPLGLSIFEEKCLRRVHVFKEICHGIDRTHYSDALHLWTAEENNLDVFLTTDRRFRNVIDRKKIELHCRIMFPSELLCSLGDSCH